MWLSRCRASAWGPASARSASAVARPQATWILSALFAAALTLVGVFHGSKLSQQAGTLGFHFLGAPIAIIAGNVITILAGAGAAALGLSPRLPRPLIILGITRIVALAAEIVIIGGVLGFRRHLRAPRRLRRPRIPAGPRA